MIQQLRQYLANNNWKYVSPTTDEDIFLFSLETENTQYSCLISIDENEGKFALYMTFPNKVPKKKRTLIASALTILNFGLFLGNFEMDFDDGEIRYKIHMYFKNLEVPIDIIDFYINYSITFLELNYDLLLNAIISGKPSKEILDEIAEHQKKLSKT